MPDALKQCAFNPNPHSERNLGLFNKIIFYTYTYFTYIEIKM